MEDKTPEEMLARSLCWHCESGVGGEYFCEQCVKIQPISPEADHFSQFDLSRRLTIDTQDLERRFHERSRKFHPDFFQQKSPKEREISLKNSALLNTAYRALRDPIRRVEYLIRLEEGAAKDIPAKAPPELLEEVIELQEAIESFRENQDPKSSSAIQERRGIISEQEKIRNRIEALEKKLFSLFEEWDRMEPTLSKNPESRKATLVRMREVLSERTYLKNIVADIETALTGAGKRE